MLQDIPYRNKELSWLSFNERVLQEAADPEVPLLERVRFLGIFSSNLDEFFRVRVATLRRLLPLGKKAETLIGHNPKEILAEIQEVVVRQHVVFDEIFQDLSSELATRRIFIINERELDEEQGAFVREYFRQEVRPHLFPLMIDQLKKFPRLHDQSSYLAVRAWKHKDSKGARHVLLEIPTDFVSRFLVLPSKDDAKYVILLDDVIRYCLDDVFTMFHYKHFDAYAIKFTRDAELEYADDYNESWVNKVATSVKQRKAGNPVRFVYDARLPADFFKLLVRKMKLSRNDTMMPGARYHNFRDFMKFPDFGAEGILYPKIQQLPHRMITPHKRLMEIMRRRDFLIHCPYQSFDSVIDFLREAAIDPKVTSIRTTIYRAAQDSSVINALINAARNGKAVTAVLEIQARFDEEANIYWGDRLQEEGVRVIFGVPGLKVHSKLCLINRREKDGKVRYAIVGTGNFNEDTARLYADHLLFTADPQITGEIRKVFRFYQNNYQTPSFSQLIVSPFNMRDEIVRLIRQEVKHVQDGKDGLITLKLNNLTDRDIVQELYAASQAGVRIKLIVRSMFSAVPGVPGFSEKIEAISIVDKYLEHSRIFVFGNAGTPLYYISSADLMPRNLDNRVEVTCPILDKRIQKELQTYLDLQWADSTKARRLDEAQLNEPSQFGAEKGTVRSQFDIYDYLKELK